MSEGDPFFRLPTELCCAVLRDWLLLKSVVRLDSAVCNTITRDILLNTIFASRQCVLSQGSPCYSYQRDIFEWLYMKKVSASGLYMIWEVNDKVCEYFQSCGGNITMLAVHHCARVTAYMSLISAHCWRINCLSLTGIEFPFVASDFELLNCNLKTLDLSGTPVTDDILELIVKQCPCITQLRIAACFSLSDICGSIIGTNLKHLKFLDIVNGGRSDTMLVAIAEQDHSTLEVIHLELYNKIIGYGIHTLLAKCAKLWSLHFSYDKCRFENFDFSLFRSLTELGIFNLTGDLTHLRSVVKHCRCLQRFELHFCVFKTVGPNSSLFSLRELTVERLPSLKILAPFGVPEDEVKLFCSMRPEVEITHASYTFDGGLFDLIW